MSFLSWIRQQRAARVCNPARNGRRRVASKRPTAYHLQFELLEDRLAPAVFTVINTLDSGTGSLRQAILASNASVGVLDTINFEIAAGTQTITPATQLPTISDPATIDGTAPAALPTQKIELKGTGTSGVADGLFITAGHSIVRGLVINNFGHDGIELNIGGANRVEGCYLGTDVTGTLAQGNGFTGVEIRASADNVIGGTAAGAGNVMSGNTNYGVMIGGFLTGQRNQILGNRIGTNAAGTAVIPNFDGVRVTNGASNNIIGGSDPAARNIISGNISSGIQAAGGDVIIGNYIGTDVTGTIDLGNHSYGVNFAGNNIRVGGTAPGEGNLVSGNNAVGIFASGTGAVIQGNFIGTDFTGNAALGNGQIASGQGTGQGLRAEGAPGGLVSGNLISGNNGMGIYIASSDGIRVENNRIGTNAAGTGDLGNLAQGVWFPGLINLATIGGTGAGAANIIAYNHGAGVSVAHQSAAQGVAILGNSIFANVSIGIDLQLDNGVTPNDTGDADGGANHQQNYPVLNAVITSGGATTVTGTLNSTANTLFRVEFFSNVTADPTGFGEGQTFLAFNPLTTDASGNVSFNILMPAAIPAGRFISATATNPANETSEFSQVRIVVQINQAPVANADAYSVSEDGTLAPSAPGVLGNDADADGNPLTAILVTGPSHGTLTLNANGSFTYTPSANYFGPDGFTYKANDGAANSNVATVSITVNPVNDAPVANNDSYSTNEDTPLTIAAPGVLGNDNDTDSNALSALPVSGPAHGALVLSANGSFTYTPIADYNGPDSFTYRANDGSANSNVATVSITVNSVNDAPIANDDTATTDEDIAAIIPVLANDLPGPPNESAQTLAITHLNGTPVTAGDTVATPHGSVTLNADGTVSYTPAPNYNGQDSFSYTIRDNGAPPLSDSANGTVTINPVNDAPVAVDDAYTIAEDNTLTISAEVGMGGVLANDTDVNGDTLSVAAPRPIVAPTHGNVILNANGSFTYTPFANFNGTDSFTYKAGDGMADSNEATVTITVTPDNDAPIANADAASTDEDTAVVIPILANDTDVDGAVDPATVTIGAGPYHGSLSLNPTTGAVTYTPAPDYNGPDSFEYTVRDDNGAISNTASVQITVNPVNDAPHVSLTNTITTLAEHASTASRIKVADIVVSDDEEGANFLTLAGADFAMFEIDNGVLYLRAGMGLDFETQPQLDVMVAVNDLTVGGNPDDTASLTIAITHVNERPVITSGNFHVPEHASFVGNLTATDHENGPLTFSIIGGADAALFAYNSAGGIGFIEPPDFEAPADSGGNNVYDLLVAVTDGRLEATQAITITVDNVKEAMNDEVSTPNSQGVTIPVLANDLEFGPADFPRVADILVPVVVPTEDYTGSIVTYVPAPGDPGPFASRRVAHGDVIVQADNSLFYEPDFGFVGDDVFYYQVVDQTGTAAIAQVTVHVERPIHIYVDDDWADLAIGVDPDGNGPATRMGVDAFARIQPALDGVTVGGLVSVAAGLYAEKLIVARNVAIEGVGAAQTVLQGDLSGRALTVNAGTTGVTVFGVTIQGGLAGEGGGVLNKGTLWLTHVVVRDNAAQDGGGGVANRGVLTVSDSTISNNLAFGSNNDPAFGNGGGIWNAGRLTVENSTVSGNQGNSAGGGFYNVAPSDLAAVNHSTVANNRAAQGAGVYGKSGIFLMRSTIVADNMTLNRLPAVDLAGFSLFSGGNNLFSRSVVLVPSDQGGTLDHPLDARLGPLADNGGATPTHALLPHSPAIDRGDADGASLYDQRGERRIEDGDGDRVKVIDIGAFEALSPAVRIVPLTGRVKQVDDGIPVPPRSGDIDDELHRLKSEAFADPHRFSAEIAFDIPDPLVGKVVFEVRRGGVVIDHQELDPTADGHVVVSYTSAQPGVDELAAWATLGQFRAYDTDVAYWNSPGPAEPISLRRTTGSHPQLVPTLTDQEFTVGTGAAGVNVTFHLFNNVTGEQSFADTVLTDSSGTAGLSQTRSREGVEELVAEATIQGQQRFDNVGVVWVFAPPQLSLLTKRTSSTNVTVTATLTRDLGPNVDDSYNLPVLGHPLNAMVDNPAGTSTLTPSAAYTDDVGQAVFTLSDPSPVPKLITVNGALRTGLESEPPDGTPFTASGFIVTNLEVTIDPPSQTLPTRESVLGGIFSAPNRAYINVKVEFGSPLQGVRLNFLIVSGPHVGDHYSAVTGADGVARFSYLNQNEFDFGDGDGDPGTDRFAVTFEGADRDSDPAGYAEVHWFPSRVTGPQSFLAQVITGTVFTFGKGATPWVHVDMEGDPTVINPSNPSNPAGPVKVRYIDPVGISGGLTSFREISAADVPNDPEGIPLAIPHGFSVGNPNTGQAARYYEIQSTVVPALNIPRLLFINKDDFPDGTHQIFHAKGGQWVPLETFDGAVIAAIDSAVNFVFDLKPDVISNLVNAAKAIADYATSEYHQYWVAITDSFSPFAIFVPTGAAPIGKADAYAVVPDRMMHVTAAYGILRNDTDADSTVLTARLVVDPQHGTLHLNADGSFDYTPVAGFLGVDTFTYRPLDGVYNGDLTTVTVFVTPNPLGLALSLDSTSIQENESAALTGSLSGPSTSGPHQVDIDWDGDGAFDQTITLAPGVRSFVAGHQYLDDGPAPGNGTPFDDNVIAVRVSDGYGGSDEGSAILRVLNVAPTADAGADQTVSEGSAVTLHGSFSDPGLLDNHTFNWHVIASNGQVVADGTDIDFTFTPVDDGTYAITFTVTDDDGGVGSDTAVVTAHNLAPTAINDSAMTNEDHAVFIAVLANDSDPAGALDPLRIDSVSNGSKGTTSIDTRGTADTSDDEIVYMPNTGATGSDSFMYTIGDGDGGYATATVTVQIRNLVDVSGRVFDDKDNDGVYEPGDGDVGIGGVTVQLFNDTSGTLIATQTTAVGGNYFFDVNLGAGIYKIVAAQPAGFLDGRETAGNLGGAVDNSQDSNKIGAINVGDPGTTMDAIDCVFAEIRPSQALGLVWNDLNNDGEVTFGEAAIQGAVVELIGLDERGKAVNRSATTDANGIYAFIDLRPSNAAGYTIRELQPAGYLDGLDSRGTVNGVAVGDGSINDNFSGVVVPRPGSVAENYNFGERLSSEGGVTAGQTAAIGFWQNKNGQKLIGALNGGSTSTQLGNWLAATLPNMYGTSGGANNLTGKTNAQVAAFYKTLFARTAQTAAGGGSPKLDAQVLATALAVYVTNQTLAGTTAAAYGFLVTTNGVGARTFNVGSNGTAFGAANQASVTVLDLLRAVNSRSRNGLLYDLDGDGDANDSLETSYRTMANIVFNAINEAGGI